VEVDVLKDLETPGRDDFMNEAARVYRARGDFLKARGRLDAARADGKRAAYLESEAKKVAAAAAAAAQKKKVAQVRLINSWNRPATVIIDGKTYRLEPGEEKYLTRPAGPFTYEIPAARQKARRKLEAGQKFTIRIGL
jgi:hypothetical protein